MYNYAVQNETNHKFNSNKKNKLSNLNNQNMESNALSSFESMSSSNLSKPLKIYQDHDSRYYLNVQTFKYTRDECLEPERML